MQCVDRAAGWNRLTRNQSNLVIGFEIIPQCCLVNIKFVRSLQRLGFIYSK